MWSTSNDLILNDMRLPIDFSLLWQGLIFVTAFLVKDTNVKIQYVVCEVVGPIFMN